MVLAGLALLVALAGAAIADPLAQKSALNKPEKKQVKRIAKNQANALIDQRAPGLSVAHAGTAGSADSAVNAANAQNATNAVNAASAGQANNATTVNGVTVQSIRYYSGQGDNPVVLLSMGGLTLTANCDGNMTLEAETAANNATLNSISFSTIGGDPFNLVAEADWDISESPQQLATALQNQVMTTHYTRPFSIGTAASAVTVQVQLQNPSQAMVNDCRITGFAFSQGG